MRGISTLSVAVTLAVLSGRAMAATFQVTPEDDVQAVIDAAPDGSTILLGPGTYTGPIALDARTGIRIRGRGGPVVQAVEGAAIYVSSCTGVTITGVTARGDTGVSVSESTGTLVTKVKVTDSGTGILVANSVDTRVLKCTVLDVSSHGIEDRAGEGTVIQDCVVDGTGGSGLELSANGWGAMIDGLVSRNVVRNTGSYGAHFAGDNTGIEKNVFETIGQNCIFLESSTATTGCVIQKNVISSVAADAIHIQLCTDTTFSKNRITDAGFRGISSFLNCSGLVFEKNSISGTGSTGISLQADGSTLVANRISGTGAEGVRIWGGDGVNVLQKNRITRAGSDGISLETGGAVLERNTVIDCGGNGIALRAGNNALTKNTANGNGVETDGVDCYHPSSDNSFTDNRFGTIDDGIE